MTIFPESTGTRIGIPEAMSRIIDVLKQGKPMSIAGLSKETNVDRRTVSKVIDMLLDVQETLRSLEIQTNRKGRQFIIRFKERTARALEILSSARAKVAKRRVQLSRQKEPGQS